MEQTLETNAARLLDGVKDIIKRYEAQWQKTGEKYNIFKVAGIARQEVIMCRVLADLLNPKGAHGRSSLYLKLFWETIASKLLKVQASGRLALDIEHTRVATEYVIDENRRIDIVLEDGNVFVPIEVKIEAGDQPKQIADYFAFARTKNRNSHVPVLYLTVDGHEPSDFSKADLGKDDYVPLSFRDDILTWLEACARENENTPETTIPVRENLRQLIAAVKSLCGKSEDTEMDKAIAGLITQSEDTIRAAVSISGTLQEFDNESKELFKGSILDMVKKELPQAWEYPDEGWHGIG
ncbi:MAG: PD-(D/E)XK nuclease family protein, partial [Spirochaetaceae bacterium]|nr:PD-(D/E)XK nuclease family protein [Spirochaetaceae bacterium]